MNETRKPLPAWAKAAPAVTGVFGLTGGMLAGLLLAPSTDTTPCVEAMDVALEMMMDMTDAADLFVNSAEQTAYMDYDRAAVLMGDGADLMDGATVLADDYVDLSLKCREL